MTFHHYVARAGYGLRPFEKHSPWAWGRLKENFPGALAATLMPNHLHLIEPSPAERKKLARILAMLSARAGLPPGTWEVAEPEPIPDRSHLARQVRYVALNPCRAKLANDPLEWPWSTYRGTLGAVVDPWVPAGRLAAALGQGRGGFRERHHAYVSGDPSVSAGGTPFPRPAPSGTSSAQPLEWVAAAAAAATESPLGAIRERTPARRIFVLLARRQGWRDAGQLALRAGVSRDAVYKILGAENSEPAEAALCLGDTRLRSAEYG